MMTYTIFDHPADFPEYWVVRAFVIRAGKEPVPSHAWLFGSLGAARHQIARTTPGLACIARSPGDDPVIVETWI